MIQRFYNDLFKYGPNEDIYPVYNIKGQVVAGTLLNNWIVLKWHKFRFIIPQSDSRA
jgi:hypothetical protein